MVEEKCVYVWMGVRVCSLYTAGVLYYFIEDFFFWDFSFCVGELELGR